MAGKFEKPTIKQHLAAIRMLFDYLVVGQILAINPAHAVRGPKHSIKRGKTPVLSAAQARELLDSIDVSTVVGLRDRALIALRATGITAYLEAGGTLGNAQAMAAHESPRTTKLYDRTGDQIALDEVERIAI
jgi:site-specific recombinase XerD